MTNVQEYSDHIALLQEDFRKRGSLEGSKHRPSTDATHLDSNESELLAIAEKWAATAQRKFDMATTAAAQTVSAAEQKQIELKAKIEQLLADRSDPSDAAQKMAAERDALAKLTESRLLTKTEWLYFRELNGINAQAVYPESHVWHFAIVAILALAETIINSFFYINNEGLIGGFTVAIGVSAVNMLLALFLGIGFRYINLKSRLQISIGWISLLFFLAAALYCNALFATFRSEYQLLTNPGDPNQLRYAFSAASQSAAQIFMFKHAFSDLLSFVLFGIGLILSAIAFWKGYGYDDKHPGYGALDRKLKEAERAEAEAQKNFRLEIQSHLDSIQANLKELLHQPTRLIGELAMKSSDLSHARQALQFQYAAITRDFQLVLKSYRAANTAIRPTPPPPHFSVLPDIGTVANIASVEPLLEEIRRVKEEVEKNRTNFQDDVNQKLDLAKKHCADVLNEQLPRYFEMITKDAQQRITEQIHEFGAKSVSTN